MKNVCLTSLVNLPVNALVNVARDLLIILKNKLRTGYFSEPHSVECSKMCGTPVLSIGVVRKATLETRNFCFYSLHRSATAKKPKAQKQCLRFVASPESVVSIISGNVQMFSSCFVVHQMRRSRAESRDSLCLLSQEKNIHTFSWSSQNSEQLQTKPPEENNWTDVW